MKILIIGLGNPILGDDGVGWMVASEVDKYLQSPTSPFRKKRVEIEVETLSLGGLSLMERMIGYDRVILIDTLITGQHPTGYVSRFLLPDLPDFTSGHTTAAHDTSLKTALRVGKQMGANLPAPENIWIVGVESVPVYDFSENLSPPITAAIPTAVEMVVAALKE